MADVKYFSFFGLIALMSFIDCKKNNELDVSTQAYLRENQSAVDFKEIKSIEKVLTSEVIKNNAVFFASEYHAVAVNKDIRLFFIKTLHQQTDTVCYFPELSYAACQLLNQYMQTGNEEILDFLYKNFKGTLEYTQENFVFWQHLREYIQSLPSSKKLIIVGCDIEHQSFIAFRYVHELLKNKTPPPAISITIDSLMQRPAINYRSPTHSAWLSKRMEEIENNKTDFQTLLGDNYGSFNYVLHNMQNAIDYIASDSNLDLRENSIWENFKKNYALVPNGKWFGQWGTYHTMQRASYKNLAWLVKKDPQSPVKNRVLGIHTMYENSYYMNLSFAATPFTNLKKNNPYNTLSETDATLFRLNNEDSPFLKKLLWWDVSKHDGGVTCDYYQFILFIRDAQASKPYK
jgi:hypothetical protein